MPPLDGNAKGAGRKVRVHLTSLVGILPGENRQQLNKCDTARLSDCSGTVPIQHPYFHVR